MILISPLFGITACVGIFIFYLSLFGMGKWIDVTLLARSKKNSKNVIIEQFYDNGALGFDGKRIVEGNNIWCWQKNTEIDTSKINWNSYKIINKEIGFIKFP